ncbi:hypothetical protein P278_05610 [Zhouia amylolytica AD3]|uniref:Uncharacterized protein n=1 Tax=Zhouia amylolytica AD3 TaxID=1286632 RepID=W2UR32_9FLAO|nr:hypothetical protein P278_05610 [Zhouia amylolytica AD3]
MQNQINICATCINFSDCVFIQGKGMIWSCSEFNSEVENN